MRLYNSLTRKKESFTPLSPKSVRLYVCGITPYDTTHLGHAFTYISFDVLVRYLTYLGYNVNYTQNVTDIDDDILKRAASTHQDWQKLGTFWTDHFLKDMKDLGIISPAHYVKATDSIPTIQKFVKKLLDKKIAYEKEGNVYFSIKRFPSYGKLSNFTKKQMHYLALERGGYPDDPRKQNPLDFLLWQKSKSNEPSWDSPWGKGRPGWHIECSSMIYDYLGKQIDIHGGGRDLVFPHHESEIAQSESFTGQKPFSRFWMHTGMLMYQGEKMGKSLGNLVMVSDLLKKYSADEIRLTLLSHHYRKPWEFEMTDMRQARKTLKLLTSVATKPVKITDQENPYLKKFLMFMDDDLNIPEALSYLITLTKQSKKQKANEQMRTALSQALSILGFRITS